MTIVSSAPAVDAAPATKLSVSHISLMHRPFGPRIHMDENASGGSEASIASTSLPADAPQEFSSASSAASYLASLRHKKPAVEQVENNNTPAESAEQATADDELAQANAEPVEEQPISEDTTNAEPEDEKLPPIERPRSWTKDVDDDWKALPRTVQEKIAAREQERETVIRRSQNEAAEKLKGVTAKEQAAEQARQQYETKIKSVVEVLEKEQLREFPDIRSMDDIEKMTLDAARLSAEAAQLWATDPFAAGPKAAEAQMLQSRLSAFQLHQQKLVAAHGELQQAETRKTQAQKDEWEKHRQTEDALAAELIPELSDKIKGPALIKRAAERLSELGFKPDELNRLANGEDKISIFDHRLQQLIHSDLKLADIQKATKAAVPKPVPPVQRPGIAPPRGAAASANIQALTRKFESSGSEKDALAILVARRASAQRRAS